MKRRLVLAIGLVAAAACSKASDPAPAATADPVGAAGSASGDGHDGHKDRPRKPGDKHNPMAADAVPLTLDVVVAGATTTWKKDTFDKVAQYKVGADGEARDVWSLRDLATTLVGSGAHVVAVTGEGGTKAMDPAEWADATRTPVLHTTRRGTLKFTWANSKGEWGETVVKDVTKIEIARP